MVSVRHLAVVVLAFTVAASAAPSEHAARRERLRTALPDSVIVLFATQPVGEFHDRNGFFQETNFYYLTGWNEPNAALVLCSACPAALKEVFFLPKPTARQERYEGKMVDPSDADAPAKTGFSSVLPLKNLEATLVKAMDEATKIYTFFDGREDSVRKLTPLRPVFDVRNALATLRMIKSEAELSSLQKAIDASIAAHLESWRVTKPGLYEYEVSAAMQETYFTHGCERNAYPPIVGSGPNSTVLHYSANRRRMDAGDLLVMDVGAECKMYAADITRTIPVNGQWSARQKEIYNLVLGAQQAAIDRAKPGIKLMDLTRFAQEYLDKQGKGPGDKPWREYMLHSISHHVGLDVHDAFDINATFAEGMVVTIEPGIYLKEENLGIRIEDMVLITKDGAKVLTHALPRNPDEIERRMKR